MTRKHLCFYRICNFKLHITDFDKFKLRFFSVYITLPIQLHIFNLHYFKCHCRILRLQGVNLKSFYVQIGITLLHCCHGNVLLSLFEHTVKKQIGWETVLFRSNLFCFQKNCQFEGSFSMSF